MRFLIPTIALALGVCNARIPTSTITTTDCNTASADPGSSSTSSSASISIASHGFSSSFSRNASSITPTGSVLSSASSTSSSASSSSSACVAKEPIIGSTDFFGYVYLGCKRQEEESILYPSETYLVKNSPENCRLHCTTGENAGRRFPYYGLQNGGTCWCSYVLDQTLSETFQTGTCNTKCTGDECQFCGGVSTIEVFYNPVIAATAPKIQLSSNGFDFIGCYIDKGDGPLFNKITFPSNINLNVDICTSDCLGAGYQGAGLIHGDICVCGNEGEGNPTTARYRECDTQCAAPNSKDKFCGGGDSGDRLQFYRYQVPA